MEAISGIAVAVLLGGGIFGVKKVQYKRLKKSIYNIIKEGIEEVDFNKIHEGVEKLKEFDINFKDLKTGEPIKALWERINCRSIRLPKMEKLQDKFGLSMDDVKDLESLKLWADKIKENVEDVGQALGIIEEEEQVDNQNLVGIKKELEMIKSRQMLKNNRRRKVVDELNLTDFIQEINKEYEVLFISTFNKQFDSKLILQRNIKKQLLENNNNSGN